MDLVIYQAIAAGLCGGITEVFKKAGLDSKFAPLSSLIIGLILDWQSVSLLVLLLV